MTALDKAKQERIDHLLESREKLEEDTERQMEAIAKELKDLGWKKPRAPRTKTAANGNKE